MANPKRPEEGRMDIGYARVSTKDQSLDLQVAPAHRRLKDAVKRAEIGVAAHQEAPPNQRTDVAEHGTKLVDAGHDPTPHRVDMIEVYVAQAAGGWWGAKAPALRRLQAPPNSCARFLTLSYR
jgi:hypothetical protein